MSKKKTKKIETVEDLKEFISTLTDLDRMNLDTLTDLPTAEKLINELGDSPYKQAALLILKGKKYQERMSE